LLIAGKVREGTFPRSSHGSFVEKTDKGKHQIEGQVIRGKKREMEAPSQSKRERERVGGKQKK